MMRERIVYFDYLETMAIFMVIYVHYNFLASDGTTAHIAYLIPQIAVPIFFMINGALLLGRKQYSIRKHYLKTLLLILSVTSWRLLYTASSSLLHHFSLRSIPLKSWIPFLLGQT